VPRKIVAFLGLKIGDYFLSEAELFLPFQFDLTIAFSGGNSLESLYV